MRIAVLADEISPAPGRVSGYQARMTSSNKDLFRRDLGDLGPAQHSKSRRAARASTG